MLAINSVLTLDTFRLLPWEHQNRAYFEPAMWDAPLADIDYFQSGIGYATNNIVVGLQASWDPILETGFYFIKYYRFFNYATRETATVYRTINPTEFVQTTENGPYSYSFALAENEPMYRGYKPAYLVTFDRYGELDDTLLPAAGYDYKHVRVFTELESTYPSGYVAPWETLEQELLAEHPEMMVNRVTGDVGLVQVTGFAGYDSDTYYEKVVVETQYINLAVNDNPNIGMQTEVFSIDGSEVFCKLRYVPVVSISGVVLTSGGSTYDITNNYNQYGLFTPSGYIDSKALPGVITFYNKPTENNDWDLLYPSGSISITYQPGLFFVYEAVDSVWKLSNKNVNPLLVGERDYNLLLTNTEIDPLTLGIGGEDRIAYIGGLPLELKIFCEFNEAPILNYPVSVIAGLSRLTLNNLILTTELRELRLDGTGNTSCLYVPPKELDDESFYFRSGHYVPTVILNNYSINSTVTVNPERLHGVSEVGTTTTGFENAMFFPTEKFAKQFLLGGAYVVYDNDHIKTNNFSGFMGVLRIAGIKKAIVLPSYFANDPKNITKGIYQVNSNEEAVQVKGFMSEFNYKYRTNTFRDLGVSFRVFSTLTDRLLVYNNGSLIGIFDEEVASNKFYPEVVTMDLTKEYFLAEPVTFNASNSYYLRHEYDIVNPDVTDFDQGPTRLYDSSGTEYTFGVDFTVVSGENRLVFNSSPAPTGLFVDYLAKGDHVIIDEVNIIRFILNNPDRTTDTWSVGDVNLNKNNRITSYDNYYSPAVPIGFLKWEQASGTQYTLRFVALDEVGEDTKVNGVLFSNLPHSVATFDEIMGYYLYTPGSDFVVAKTETSYGKEIVSPIFNIEIKAPAYMRGLYYSTSNEYFSASPYAAIEFKQVVV